MTAKRMQGRPPRDSGASGRERLIEATRLYLRSKRKLELTRSEIAECCGVTPALISYYFKDKRSLLDAVSKPLVETYRLQLLSILHANTPVQERIRGIIRLFIVFNAENAFIFEYFLQELGSDHVRADELSALVEDYREILDLFQQLMTDGTWRPLDPALVQLALWGMCKAFAEAPLLPVMDFGADVSEVELLARKVEFIFTFFDTGMARQNVHSDLVAAP